MQIITLKEAKELGLKRFYTGVPCSRGHLVERSVSSRGCLECLRENMAKSRGNEGAPRKSDRQARDTARSLGDTIYYTGIPCPQGHDEGRYVANAACTRCVKNRVVTKHKADPEARSAKRIAQYNNDRERVLEQTREYRKLNPHVGRAKIAKRRASTLQRTPKWADLVAIKEIYKDCPESYVVDHIIPLQGELVSGLHVPSNLQYLTGSDNSSKRNKFDPWTFEGP